MSSARRLAALVLLAGLTVLAAAQEDLPRGSYHDTSAALARLREVVPDVDDRDIILITLDCAAARLLPVYGEGGPPMPNLLAFANESILFANARSVSPNRLSAAIAVQHSLFPGTAAALGSTEKSDSLASRLGDAGFGCYAIVRPEFFAAEENLGAVETNFDFDRRATSATRNPASMLSVIERRISDRRSGERLFGWVHLDLTWPPATTHPGFRAASSRFEDHYRASLVCIDAFLGDLARMLAAARLDERTIVVLTGLTGLGDLDQSGRGLRQRRLDEAELAVPLLIHVAGLKPERIMAPVATVDVAPTLLELAGVPLSPTMQGRSFLDLLMDARAREKNEGLLFAELLEWVGEPLSDRRLRVADGSWSLVAKADGSEPVLARVAPGPPDPDAEAQALARLRRAAEDFRIYEETCARVWAGGIYRPIALDEPLGRLGRARFLARSGRREEAAAIVSELAQRDGDHLEATIRTAIDCGIAPSSGAATALLQHPRARVRGLAGAWVARHEKNEVALDQALTSLANSNDVDVLAAILLALGQSGSERAREAIRNIDIKDDELAARRDLALVRLGDAEAVARLPQRFLTPRAGYDRLPFLDAIEEKMPEKLIGLARLYLEDGDGDRRVVRAVLDRLERANALEAAPSLAAAIPALDSELRGEVEALLRRWHSFAGARAAVALAPRSPADADFAARSLLLQPGLVSSPFVPSLRMDHYCSRFEDPAKRTLAAGASLTSDDRLEFTIDLEGAREGFVVTLFRMADDAAEIDPNLLLFEAQFNDKNPWVRPESLRLDHGVWSAVARLRPETIEPGLEKVLIRLRHRDREPLEAQALAFIVLPDTPTKRMMIAGLDVRPLFGAPVLRSGGLPAGDADSYEIFLRRDPFADVAGEVRVLAGGKTFARFALRDFPVPRRLEIALPDWAGPESLIELQAVDVPTASGLSAILYGCERKEAPRER